MSMLRFLHSSDLHLGRAFGNLPEGIRHRLREARHGAIARLATAARQGGARLVLLAGDTFDAETPAPETLRQALRAEAERARKRGEAYVWNLREKADTLEVSVNASYRTRFAKYMGEPEWQAPFKVSFGIRN